MLRNSRLKPESFSFYRKTFDTLRREQLFIFSRDMHSLGYMHIISIGYTSVVFNLFGGTEPQGCIPVARGTPVHISAQESKDRLSIVAFLKLLAETLDCAGGTLVLRGTPVENYAMHASGAHLYVSFIG